MKDALPFPWDMVLQLQMSTDTASVGGRAHARDEALNQLLEQMKTGILPSTAANMERRYRTLTANRARKYRYRNVRADQVAHHVRIQHEAPDASETAGVKELAALATVRLAPGDRQLVFAALGLDMPYQLIASILGKPVGTLKARVSRLRRRLRHADVAGEIRITLVAA